MFPECGRAGFGSSTGGTGGTTDLFGGGGLGGGSSWWNTGSTASGMSGTSSSTASTFGNWGAPATTQQTPFIRPSTKFSELAPNVQKKLLEIESAPPAIIRF